MSNTNSRRVRAAALVGAGVAGGVIGAWALSASADTGTPAATPTTTTTSTPAAPDERGDRHGGPGNGETPLTGTKSNTLKAAALAKVPGGTVEDVTTETDHAGAAYEVHVTKADGTRVKVLFDTNLKYVTTETDTGHGDHSGGGRGRGDETTVTGAKADTLKAAALKQVPGASVEEISTDSGDATYEVHLKKADGTKVTAKFDKDLKFISVETGRGK